MSTASEPLLPSGILFDGRYRIDQLLGVGATAAVYSARDTELDESAVAIKLGFMAARDPQRIARFREEASITHSLNHPNIVQTFSFHTTADGIPYQVMALVRGCTLRERLAQGHIGLAERHAIASAVLSAVSYAHDRGIAHRDLKPSNIFLGTDGEVKLGDFGIAHALERELDLTRSGEILGTLAYMAPEQQRGGAVTPAADIFAFGLICFELLANEGEPCDSMTPGALGFDAGSRTAAIHNELKRSNDPWSEFIRRCLALDPEERPAASALKETLEQDRFRSPEHFGGGLRSLAARRWYKQAAVAIALALAGVIILLRIPGMQPTLLSWAVLIDLERGPAVYTSLRTWAGAAAQQPSRVDQLHYFVRNGQTAAVRALLVHGVPADARDNEGRTAACEAFPDSEVEVIALLFEFGADPNQRCVGDVPIVVRALYPSNEVLFKQLMRYHVTPTPLAFRHAMGSGNGRIIGLATRYWSRHLRRLVREDKDLFDSLLGWENTDAVARILRMVPDPASVTAELSRPVSWATVIKHPKLVKVLLDKFRADPLIAREGETPAWLEAITHNAPESLALLRERGFDVLKEYPGYGTPLQAAVAIPRDEIVQQLLGWGSKPRQSHWRLNTANRRGQSPLPRACRSYRSTWSGPGARRRECDYTPYLEYLPPPMVSPARAARPHGEAAEPHAVAENARGGGQRECWAEGGGLEYSGRANDVISFWSQRVDVKRIIIAAAALALLGIFAACSTDCVYDFYTNDAGEEACGRYCPLEDSEGNTTTDRSGDIVYDDPEEVNRVNCVYAATGAVATATPTATATATPTPTVTE